jgi:hypothetical protein
VPRLKILTILYEETKEKSDRSSELHLKKKSLMLLTIVKLTWWLHGDDWSNWLLGRQGRDAIVSNPKWDTVLLFTMQHDAAALWTIEARAEAVCKRCYRWSNFELIDQDAGGVGCNPWTSSRHQTSLKYLSQDHNHKNGYQILSKPDDCWRLMKVKIWWLTLIQSYWSWRSRQ